MPHRIFARKIVTHECLIDKDQRCATCNLGLIPKPSAAERNSQCGEVLGADKFDVRLLALGGRFTQDVNGKCEPAVGGSRIRGDSRGKDAGGCRDFVPKLGDEEGAISPCGVRVFPRSPVEYCSSVQSSGLPRLLPSSTGK
jgi:hypothetical protein